MDKSWMDEKFRFSEKYISGVKSFIKFVKENMPDIDSVRCPCVNCLNTEKKTIDQVDAHLFLHGISRSYRRWTFHGEAFETSAAGEPSTDYEVSQDTMAYDDDYFEGDRVPDLINDVRRGSFVDDNQTEMETQGVNIPANVSRQQCKNYLDKLMEETERKLYPGCKKYSTLGFVIKMLHLKVRNHMSNKATDDMLKLFKNSLPEGETLPDSFNEAKSMLRGLGLGYEMIHACKYDCALFWKEYEDRQECPVCGESRWKTNNKTGKRIPHKILRYFPLKPRLSRLFMSKEIAEDMRWHKERRVNDENVMRHPADSYAWKSFDEEHKWFADEACNVRLGLATDGFNPFGNMSNSYSMWPVILVPYNLPPWKCMKEPFFMMTLLIPGPNAPGKDLGVYLKPLIEELKELWDVGVTTHDAFTGRTFQLHAALLWTINDLPAYANLSLWSTKGYMACPTCNEETSSQRLRNKICYMDHRRFLPQDHIWRKSRKFNGKQESRFRPKELIGDDVLEQLSLLGENKPGKHPNNKKRKRAPQELNYDGKSILFELPYWKTLKLRHNLDVMHIEKNIGESVLGTLLNIEGKTKDTYKARLDLEDLKIRRELHLKPKGSSYEMPVACYTLPKENKESFCDFIKSVKFPDGYASNIARCVNADNNKLSGLKSHDYHVLLQRLLPIGVRGYLNKDVYTALVELGNFFKELCCKTLEVEKLETLQKEIVLILCKLEMIYPPAFFDVMVHLAIHLPDEAILGGPVQYRWMYPIERFLRTLKGYVRNKARPEGSIAEAYVVNECLTFCSLYLDGVETKFNQAERNEDGNAQEGGLSVFSQKVRLFRSNDYDYISSEEWEMAHWYVLNNCEDIQEYLDQHLEKLKDESPLNLEQRQREQFPRWFKEHMTNLYNRKDERANDQLYALARGPDRRAKRYPGCIVNGVRFHTKARDNSRRTQNCGLLVRGDHENQDCDFYGLLTDIIELEYLKDCRVILFKCEWFDTGNKKRKGIVKDEHFTSINTKDLWYQNDPFVLASQANQVFYVNDTKLGNDWKIVQEFQHRHVYDVPEAEIMDLDEEHTTTDGYDVYQESETIGQVGITEVEMGPLDRNDVDPDTIMSDVVHKSSQTTYGNIDSNYDSGEDNDDTINEYYEEQVLVDADEDSDMD